MSLIGLVIMDIESGRPYVVVDDRNDLAVARDLTGEGLTYRIHKDEVGRLKGVKELFVILGYSKYLVSVVSGNARQRLV